MWAITYGCFSIYTYKYPQFRGTSPSPNTPFSEFLWLPSTSPVQQVGARPRSGEDKV